MTPADMLEAGAAWLETHEWTRRLCAADILGEYVDDPRSPEDCAWCGIGCVYAGAPEPITLEDGGAADNAFASANDGMCIADFNDAPGRTKSEVIAAMRAAAVAWRLGQGVVDKSTGGG